MNHSRFLATIQTLKSFSQTLSYSISRPHSLHHTILDSFSSSAPAFNLILGFLRIRIKQANATNFVDFVGLFSSYLKTLTNPNSNPFTILNFLIHSQF